MNAARDFANQQFFLECANLTLEKSGKSELTAHGPGELWQDDQGVLHFKLFLLEGFSRFMHTCGQATRIGVPRNAEEYFALRASNSACSVWESDHVFPTSFKEIGRDAGLVMGRIAKLSQTSPYPAISCHWVELRCRGNINYPPTINHERIEMLGGKKIGLQSLDGAAQVNGPGYVLTFFHQGSHTVIRYEGSQAPPDLLSLRIRESLQFCLASLVDCLTETYVAQGAESETVTLLSSMLSGDFNPGGYPPLRFHDDCRSRDFWKIFKCYFDYVCGCEEQTWHPVSIRVGEIIASRRVSLPSEALALCVGVEGVANASRSRLKQFLAQSVDKRISDLDNEARALHEAIKIVQNESSIEQKIKHRILQAMNLWLGEKPMDLVVRFLDATGMPSALLDSWKTLRNRGAHGGGLGTLAVEDTIKLRNEVLHLFYSLVLAIIDYEGDYTDYSRRDWPITSNYRVASSKSPEGAG
jgi:hypothetical protein